VCVCLFVSYSTGIRRRRRMEFGRRNQGRLVLEVALQFILFMSSPLCVLNYLRYELLPVAWALPTLGRPPASWAASRSSSRLILQVLQNNQESNRNNPNQNQTNRNRIFQFLIRSGRGDKHQLAWPRNRNTPNIFCARKTKVGSFLQMIHSMI